MAVLRTLLGEALRTTRLRQERTLREVSSAAQVSLGYLSEVERGQKEASSELLASICRALGRPAVRRPARRQRQPVGPRARARSGAGARHDPRRRAGARAGRCRRTAASLRLTVRDVRDVVAAA